MLAFLRRPFLGLVFLLPGSLGQAQNVQHGLRVPEGFEVTEYADSKLANDIYRMTVDPQGRIVVSGRGYLRILIDDNNDGRADRSLDFADGPKDGAMGLHWEGNWLYYTGDGGLRRYRVAKDGNQADGPSELVRKMKTGGEHDAHDIRRGPDGWLYVLCGNNTGIDRGVAQLPTSPIKEPVAGCVLRFSPDLKSSEIVADGFRNPYGMDFNLDGELFTYDSDNERCVGLPWYEFTRFYHVIPGGHYGWQSPQRAQTWRMPPYFPDVVAPVTYLNRGSPTGVACYRHTQFPERYQGGMFALDWTFGVVYFLPLRREGASYRCKPEAFLQAVGDNGFAPTDILVHPTTGHLFISIGGRGTRGAIYQVRFLPKEKAGKPEKSSGLLTKPRSLDWKGDRKSELLQKGSPENALERLHFLHLVLRHQQHFTGDEVASVIQSNWDHPDRSVRQAAANLVAEIGPYQRLMLGRAAKTPRQEMTWCQGVRNDPDLILDRLCRVAGEKTADADTRLTAVRLMQSALGGLMSPKVKGSVWEGYSPRRASLDKNHMEKISEALRLQFPTGHADLDREIARTLAMIEADGAELEELLIARITADSSPLDDLHLLIVLARLTGPRSEKLSSAIASTLLALDGKLDRLRAQRDTNWPLRIAELHAELARKNAHLNAALINHRDFGRPDHVVFTRCPGFDRRRAGEVFLARSEKNAEYPWTPAMVALLGLLPEEKSLPVLRKLWDRGGLEESILPILAPQPREEDREKFQQGMNSPQLATMRLCLEALEKLPRKQEGTDLLPLIRALRRLSDAKEEAPLRDQLAQHLQQLTGQKNGTDRQKWIDWFTQAHPNLAAKLRVADGVDVEGWNRRLAKIDWSSGEAKRGQEIYHRAACASCHSGAQALGPDLRGVAGRFSRDDLFTSILQPSRDISTRYRTTMVATQEGKVYQGSIVYEAVDSLILQTGPATTIRITNQQIAARRLTDTSLMPAGLLDKLSDRDLADLYAYLRSLGVAKD